MASIKLVPLKRTVLPEASSYFDEGSSVKVSVKSNVAMTIDSQALRIINDRAKTGKQRCENDQNASIEYAGICYSR